MKTIVIILCLIPTLAFAAVKLNFKDKTSMCGAYELKGNQYCKSVGGGEMCWQKTDIASAEKVDECEEGGYAQGSGGNANANTVRNSETVDLKYGTTENRHRVQEEERKKGEEEAAERKRINPWGSAPGLH